MSTGIFRKFYPKNFTPRRKEAEDAKGKKDQKDITQRNKDTKGKGKEKSHTKTQRHKDLWEK